MTLFADYDLSLAYHDAVSAIRTGELYTLPVPSSIDVAAAAHRRAVVCSCRDVRAWCHVRGLALADMEHDRHG